MHFSRKALFFVLLAIAGTIVITLIGGKISSAQEISKEQAISKINEFASQDHHCCPMNNISQLDYVFLKHVGEKDKPQFIMYLSDQSTKIIGKESGKISFIKPNNGTIEGQFEYYSNDTNDRYVWHYHHFVPIWSNDIFVDSHTGEIIGYISAGCGGCY